MQRLTINMTAMSGGKHFSIDSVYLVNNELILIAKYSAGGRGATSSIEFLSDTIIVNTGSDTPLPVRHYLLNDKNKSIEMSDFQSIKSVDDIRALLTQGVCLHKTSPLHKRDLRVKLLEKSRANPIHHRALTFNAASSPKPVGEHLNLLNIYLTQENNQLKIILESVHDVHALRPIRIENTLHFFGELSKNFISFPDDLYAQQDRSLYFTAPLKGKDTSFETRASVYTLPLHKPEIVLHFLLLLQAAIELTTRHPSEFDFAYTHVQLSPQSILASFDDLFIAKILPPNVETDAHIVNKMPISIEAFMKKAGTLHEPVAFARQLLSAILKDDWQFSFDALHHYLRTFELEFSVTGYEELADILCLMVRASRIGYHNVMAEASIATALQIEERLLNARYHARLKPFILNFQRLKSNMYGEAVYFKTFNHADAAILRQSTLQLHEDRRLSFRLPSTMPAEEAKTTLKKLLDGFKWELDVDSDPAETLIFTRASSLQVRAFAFHLTPLNVRLSVEPTNVPATSLVDATFALIPASTSIVSSRIIHHTEALALLEQLGISTFASYQLLSDHPNCIEWMRLLQKEKIFTEDTRHNQQVFANLIYLADFLQSREGKTGGFENKPLDTFPILIHLYRLLSNDPSKKGFITPTIHLCLQTLAIGSELSQALEIVQHLMPLDQHKVDRLFSEPHLYFELLNRMTGWTHIRECMIRLFDPAIDRDQIKKLSDALHCGSNLKEWLNATYFILLVERITECDHILTGLHYLHQNNCLEEQRVAFLANPSMAVTFRKLVPYHFLNKELIQICLSQPRAILAAEAIAISAALRGIDFLTCEPQKAMQVFMANDAFREVTMQFAEHIEISKLPDSEKRVLYTDFRLLMQSAGLYVEDPNSFFSRKRKQQAEQVVVPPLDNCMRMMRGKYKLGDEIVTPTVRMES